MLNTELFPFPHIVSGRRLDGSILPWPRHCATCTTCACANPPNAVVALCSYGYSYQRVSPDIVVAGVVLRNGVAQSQARNKRLREARETAITMEVLQAATERLRQQDGQTVAAVEQEKKRVIDEYIRTQQYRTDFLSALRPTIEKGLSFVHDYKQINTQISQNINALVESRYIGTSFDDKLRQATHNEKAIYESSKFLEEKLTVAKFLIHPEHLDVRSDWARFRFHGVVTKYLKIYTRLLDQKRVKVALSGESFADIVAHPQAVAVIPHTLIDNATKYSPRGGKVDILVQDFPDGIEFAVSSFGPRILDDEKERIFEAFYRGACAQKVEEEGAGFGLYVAQLVAVHHLGTKITVEQESQQKASMGHWTTFAVNLPLRARTEEDTREHSPNNRVHATRQPRA